MDWRPLLYNIGFLASLLFTLRFVLQWLYSEKKGRSKVPPFFWTCSLLGNVVMLLHGCIQVQVHVAAIQAVNALISWRNMRLMKRNTAHWSARGMLLGIGAALGVVLLVFALQSQLLIGEWDWIRTPKLPWQNEAAVSYSLVWHLVGSAGMMLFAARFWIQWWQLERYRKVGMSAVFWWMSLVGGTCSLIYFMRLGDVVNILGYGTGLIPYARNLMLIRKQNKASQPKLDCDLFVFAGEVSGDMLGSGLMRALREKRPGLKIGGVGGPLMRELGMDLLLKMERFQVIGFTEVIRSLPRMVRLFFEVRNAILKTNPETVVLIDFPGFNLRMAKSLRKHGYKGRLVHYVCPTVWAHGKARMKTLIDTLDTLLCIFPFEPKLFNHTPLDAHYVGNPLVEKIDSFPYTASWRERYYIPKEKRLVGLFPGSRKREVSKHLPAMLAAARRLYSEQPDLHFIIPAANESREQQLKELVNNDPLFTIIEHKDSYHLMHEAVLALAAAGTVALELGLHKVPTVAVYALSYLDYLIATYLFKIDLKYFCMPNILADEKLFAELIYIAYTPENLYQTARRFLSDRTALKACIDGCSEVKAELGSRNASQEAAVHVLG